MDFNDWLNKGYNFYMAVVVIISGGCGLRIEARHSNQPSKSKLSLYSRYFHFTIPFKQLYTSCKMERFSYKNVHVRMHVEEELAEPRGGVIMLEWFLAQCKDLLFQYYASIL